MQEYIDWINEMYNSPISLTFTEVDFRTLEQFRKKAETLLEKEKQQLKDAALSNVTKNHKLRAIFENQFEQYYNETFNK